VGVPLPTMGGVWGGGCAPSAEIFASKSHVFDAL